MELEDTYKEKDRGVQSEGSNANRAEENLNCPALEGCEIKHWRCVVLNFVLVFIFAFDFSFLAFEVKNGSSLRMIERGRSVERAQEEGEEDDTGDGLESDSPTKHALGPTRKHLGLFITKIFKNTFDYVFKF